MAVRSWDLSDVINQRVGDKRMGFGAAVEQGSDHLSATELLGQIQPEDLMRYGLIPEFVGRMPVVATLDELDEDALVQILTQPKNALVRQYRRLFRMDGVTLDFDDGALLAVARQALKQKTGARGLRSILERIMLDYMYEIPGRQDLTDVKITEEMISQANQGAVPFAETAAESA